MAGVLNLLSGVGAGVLALVFARSAAHKLTEFSFFSTTLGEYRVLPKALVGPAAIALALAEALAIVFLIIPDTRAIGAMLAAGLLALYALAMTLNLRRGRFRIDCGCGGPGQMISWSLVARNSVLTALAAFVSLNTGSFDTIQAGTLAVFAGVLLCWLLLAIFDQIIGNRSHAQAM
jgi:hypothetical protein